MKPLGHFVKDALLLFGALGTCVTIWSNGNDLANLILEVLSNLGLL